MDDINLIHVVPLKGVRRPNNKLLLTQKFVDGMALYRELWKGPVTLVCEPTDEASNNLDNVEVDIETAPFRTVCEDYSSVRLASLLREKAIVVVTAGEWRNGISRICKRAHVPCVYLTEQSLRTRLDIIKADRLGVLRSVKRSLRQFAEERAQVDAIKIADGVQCNGTPTYDAYKSLTADPLLYFDNRTDSSMLATVDQISARIASLRFGRPIHLAFSGRLISIKGVNDLVDVAFWLRNFGLPFEMTICGDGDQLPVLRQKVAAAELENFVKFPGILEFKSQLLPFLKDKVDLFVCCHPQGDPSCTYVETMACGVPIAGYANEAFAGLVKVADVGWTTRVNEPRELARKITEIYGDLPRLARASERSLEFAREHTFERTFQQRIEHLDRIADCVWRMSSPVDAFEFARTV